MLLSIDTTKVSQQLKEAKPSYVITTCNIPEITIDSEPTISISIVSTSAAMPPDLVQARERLLALRRQLIDHGEAPLAAADLDRALDSTRGRI